MVAKATAELMSFVVDPTKSLLLLIFFLKGTNSLQCHVDILVDSRTHLYCAILQDLQNVIGSVLWKTLFPCLPPCRHVEVRRQFSGLSSCLPPSEIE